MPEERRLIDRIFRWVRSQSAAVPPGAVFRIFAEAARRVPVLVDRAGTEERDPLLGGAGPTTSG